MSVYSHPRSKYYWCRFHVRGHEFRLSTGKTNRREAESEERRLRAEREAAAAATAARPAGGVDLATLAGLDVERATASGVSADHLKTLEHQWSSVVSRFGGVALGAITYDSLQRYIAARRKAGVREQTIRREVQAVRRGLAIAKRRGWILTVPDAPKIKSDPPNLKRKGKLVPVEAIREWLAAMPDDVRDHATVAAVTGLRAKELERLEASWVEPAPPGSATELVLRIPAHAAKTGQERIVGLPDAAHSAIRRQVERRPQGGPLWGSENHKRARATACRAIGYQGTITLRDLRHTYATLGLAATGDQWATMAALGHSDLRTTSIYQSTTTERAAAVGAAAAAQILSETGAPPLEHHGVTVDEGMLKAALLRVVELVGAAGFELAAPSSQSTADECTRMLAHLLACNNCQKKLADELWWCLNAPVTGALPLEHRAVSGGR